MVMLSAMIIPGKCISWNTEPRLRKRYATVLDRWSFPTTRSFGNPFSPITYLPTCSFPPLGLTEHRLEEAFTWVTQTYRSVTHALLLFRWLCASTDVQYIITITPFVEHCYCSAHWFISRCLDVAEGLSCFNCFQRCEKISFSETRPNSGAQLLKNVVLMDRRRQKFLFVPDISAAAERNLEILNFSICSIPEGSDCVCSGEVDSCAF